MASALRVKSSSLVPADRVIAAPDIEHPDVVEQMVQLGGAMPAADEAAARVLYVHPDREPLVSRCVARIHRENERAADALRAWDRLIEGGERDVR